MSCSDTVLRYTREKSNNERELSPGGAGENSITGMVLVLATTTTVQPRTKNKEK